MTRTFFLVSGMCRVIPVLSIVEPCPWGMVNTDTPEVTRMRDDNRELLTIGQLAAAAQVTRKAVRVWTGRGLLAPVERTASGYQLFAPQAVGTAVFVRRARDLGLGLDAAARILRARRESTQQPCATVRALLAERIGEIDTLVADLLAIRAEVAAAATRPEPTPGAEFCGLIESERPVHSQR
ncbi:MerR family transcriptional regulator [Streptomyces sp. NPDC048341]|uniref:MerR family transcriptional regulator n=1 Tax=unclassified Streptomyces TaxID=2593676 RepID=UPI00344063B5